MEVLKRESGSGFLAGIVGILLLGEIIAVLGMPIDDAVKFGRVIFDIGIAGAIWVFMQELFEGDGSDVYKAALAIAVAVLIAFAW
ncbi:hypothetical protein TEU_05635 [Thermococcus eurythermalis]|uniref:Uncharacterized protein n=1 Tax=Thermococcus eurythermalis TaxID=1505907 RepID=A0A097QTQ7_9EURY|nr:hypothetical protein [Thermococcus eurythermalis]AIU69853.1 hypothetical protein TEU_05635 [Thermococcus eurythermalis]